jgi:hypothetical protein
MIYIALDPGTHSILLSVCCSMYQYSITFQTDNLLQRLQQMPEIGRDRHQVEIKFEGTLYATMLISVEHRQTKSASQHHESERRGGGIQVLASGTYGMVATGCHSMTCTTQPGTLERTS